MCTDEVPTNIEISKIGDTIFERNMPNVQKCYRVWNSTYEARSNLIKFAKTESTRRHTVCGVNLNWPRAIQFFHKVDTKGLSLGPHMTAPSHKMFFFFFVVNVILSRLRSTVVQRLLLEGEKVA